MKECAYIPQPKPTGGTEKDSEGREFPAYKCDGFPAVMKWSGKKELPAIGAKVKVTMNSLGPAEVVGYYESHGYLGLMVKFENPPEWYRRQVKNNIEETNRALKIGPEKAQVERIRAMPEWVLQGIGVVFGAEVAL